MYCQCCLMYRFSMHLQIAPSKQNNKQKMLKNAISLQGRVGCGVWGMPLFCWNDATFCMNSPVDCDNCQWESGGTRVRHRVALLLILFYFIAVTTTPHACLRHDRRHHLLPAYRREIIIVFFFCNIVFNSYPVFLSSSPAVKYSQISHSEK